MPPSQKLNQLRLNPIITVRTNNGLIKPTATFFMALIAPQILLTIGLAMRAVILTQRPALVAAYASVGSPARVI